MVAIAGRTSALIKNKLACMVKTLTASKASAVGSDEPVHHINTDPPSVEEEENNESEDELSDGDYQEDDLVGTSVRLLLSVSYLGVDNTTAKGHTISRQAAGGGVSKEGGEERKISTDHGY